MSKKVVAAVLVAVVLIGLGVYLFTRPAVDDTVMYCSPDSSGQFWFCSKSPIVTK